MKRTLALFMALVMLLGVTACGKDSKSEKTPQTTTATAISTTASTTGTTATESTNGTTEGSSSATETSLATTTGSHSTVTVTVPSSSATKAPTTTAPTKPAVKAKLNGVSLSEYTIVYGEEALDYTDRAATYIRTEIFARTGAYLDIVTDDTTPTKHEIVVGETNRSISKALNAKTEGLEFSLMAKDGHVAMEGDYFIIAAAAYYFVATYIGGTTSNTAVPTKATVCEPIQEKPDNFIFLIGDGMGVNHTLLPNEYNHNRFDSDAVDANDFTDGENFFYGYLFPNQGTARTHNVYGQVTDSAASATALATGYKTSNGRIGKDKDTNDLKSLTELAGDLGMNTAIMSTEGRKGATPGGFSAHADMRDMYDDIVADQDAMTKKYGTIVDCNYDYYTGMSITFYLEKAINNTLNQINQGDKGFFMMYEEAFIDKHSHNREKEKATWAVFRFNQAIALFMEFAFYHPNTFILITADHETGSLTNMGGVLTYGTGDHSDRVVPVFAYGMGTEVFDGQEIENVQIPKTIAKMWGQTLAEDTDEQYPPLN